MNPERQALIGILLISIILTAWLVYVSIEQRPLPPEQDTMQFQTASTVTDTAHHRTILSLPVLQDSTFRPYFATHQEFVTIETPLYKAILSSRGATIRRWFLKHYRTWNGYPVQLIPWSDSLGGFGISFVSPRAQEIDTRWLHFQWILPTNQWTYQLDSTDTLRLQAILDFGDGRHILKTFTFYGDRYSIDADVQLQGLHTLIANRRYDILWNDLIKYQEWSSVDESYYAYGAISLNDDLEKLDATDIGEIHRTHASGKIDYLAVKTKFFAVGIIPKNPSDEAVGYLSGTAYPAPEEGYYERYNIRYRLPYRGHRQDNRFTLYLGPLDYDLVEPFGMEALIDLGWEWIVRPIGEYFMMPIFKAVHTLIPNYGFAIIIFSILIKLLLHPLTIQQLRSAEKMRLLQPEIEKIRKKYKDEPKLQQQEILKLYQQYHINPAGGCLPMLLQLPILYSLYMLFNSFIELRQAPFILWIHDLSIPDFVITFPFRIPLFNVDKLSGLAILMAASLLIQQKMTITDPRQKALVYIMPILFLFLFSNFPSGLNLYYFTFNIIGIFQQLYLRKYSKSKITLEDLKRKPGKESWFQRRLREMQELAETQNKSIPGLPNVTAAQRQKPTKSKYQRKKKRRRS